MTIRNFAHTHLTSDDYRWLTCDKVNMHRIINRLVTRGDDYLLYILEGEYTVIVSKYVDLDMMRQKLKGIQFTSE